MTKSQKKALRFAYRLMCGDFNEHFLTYTSGSWIEPDHDPLRPYLDENVLTELTIRGYMDCQTFKRDRVVYLYRITPEGCAAMGWLWPINHPAQSYTRQHPLFDMRGRSRQIPLPPRYHPAVFGRRTMRTMRRMQYNSRKMA